MRLLLFILFFIRTGSGENCLVMFWNLENLFTTSPYFYKKINSIAKHVYLASEGNLPVLIGISEIENFQVCWRIANVTSLAPAGYGIVHADSPDHRGIDVALLYRKDRFRLIYKKFYPITDSKGEMVRTRLTLYAKGVLDGLDTLHLVVMHWPSKWGGEKATIPAREAAAKVLNSITDSVLNLNSRANILAMGDLNEVADSSSHSVGIQKMVTRLKLLRPVSSSIRTTGTGGTIRFNGIWETIDHFLVSENMLNRDEPVYCSDSLSSIYSHPLLLERDKVHLGLKPKRSFIGPRYNGGISDHLPIVLTIKRSW